MRYRHFLTFLAIVGLLAACTTPRDEAIREGWKGHIVAYQKVVSDRHGVVGYVKVYEYRDEPYPDSFRLYHVFDLDFRERGVLNEGGTGKKYVYLPLEEGRSKGVPVEERELQAQPFLYNVGQVLEVGGELKVLPATEADLKRPGT